MNDLEYKDILYKNFIKSKMKNICEKEYNYFLSKRNVVGVAIGNKIFNGQKTLEKCLTVLVKKKVPENELSAEDIIPKKYKGFSTDVIESGEIKATSLSGKVRPMIFGYSIGPLSRPVAGTAGYLVRDCKGNCYILANSHVLAGLNELPLGTPIVQPGVFDGGTAADTIATLSKFIPLKFRTPENTPENIVDAAIAKFVNPCKDASNIIYDLGKVRGINLEPTIGLKVTKVGRTTEKTTSEIVDTNATVSVTYEPGKTAIFINQLITNRMTEAGDSGSLLLDSENKAVGLSFANAPFISMFNPIDVVLKELNVFI